MDTTAVKLRNSFQIYHVDTNNLFVKHNTDCIVETEHGIDIAKVIKPVHGCHHHEVHETNGKLLRIATSEDLETLKELEEIESKAFKVCRDKAKEKNLNMKLVAVKCLFDKTKTIFYFVAENRIDFRELVRDLAAVFRTRIEMRQIGVRDEARLTGGFGPCGKRLCCAYMKEEFEPVSIKMAKEQNLNLNSIKISGMCGRLLCCLGYEYETYKEFNHRLPNLGTEILIGNESFEVCGLETLKEQITIRYHDNLLSIKNSEVKHVDGKYRLSQETIDKLIKGDSEEESDEQPEDDKFKVKG